MRRWRQCFVLHCHVSDSDRFQTDLVFLKPMKTWIAVPVGCMAANHVPKSTLNVLTSTSNVLPHFAEGEMDSPLLIGNLGKGISRQLLVYDLKDFFWGQVSHALEMSLGTDPVAMQGAGGAGFCRTDQDLMLTEGEHARVGWTEDNKDKSSPGPGHMKRTRVVGDDKASAGHQRTAFFET